MSSRPDTRQAILHDDGQIWQEADVEVLIRLREVDENEAGQGPLAPRSSQPVTEGGVRRITTTLAIVFIASSAVSATTEVRVSVSSTEPWRAEDVWVWAIAETGRPMDPCIGEGGDDGGIDFWVKPPRAAARSLAQASLACGRSGDTRPLAFGSVVERGARLPGAWFDWPGEYRVWASHACGDAERAVSDVIVIRVREPPDAEKEALALARAAMGLDPDSDAGKARAELRSRHPDSRYGQMIRLDRALAGVRWPSGSAEHLEAVKELEALAHSDVPPGVRASAASALLELPASSTSGELRRDLEATVRRAPGFVPAGSTRTR